MNRSINLYIDGMTCGNCAKHVESELQKIDEIHEIMITLKPEGTTNVTITLNNDVSDDVLREAVEEAGYTLVEVRR